LAIKRNKIMKLDRAQTQANLTHVARRITGLDIVVSTSEYNGKDGWKAYGKGTCEKHPNSYTLHIAQSLDGEGMVEPMRKGMAACMKGDQHKDTGMLSNGRGKTNKAHLDAVTASLDMRTQCKDKKDQTTNRDAIINCGHAAVIKGEKVARGNNTDAPKTITYTGSNGVGGTTKFKVDSDFVIGNSVLKMQAVCKNNKIISLAPDEEQMLRAMNKAAEVQAKVEAKLSEVEIQLAKAQAATIKAEARQAQLEEKLKAYAA
jgi:hypothetical protein